MMFTFSVHITHHMTNYDNITLYWNSIDLKIDGHTHTH